MQQFSTTLAGSHSPHDQSNSLSLSHSLSPQTASDMRLALLLMRNYSSCVSNYLHPAHPHYTFRHILTHLLRPRLHKQEDVFQNVSLLLKGKTEHMYFMDSVQFQDQGQRPVSPGSRGGKSRCSKQFGSWALLRLTSCSNALIPHIVAQPIVLLVLHKRICSADTGPAV